MTTSGWTITDLVCPVCREPVSAEAESLRCSACGNRFVVDDGVPVMVSGGKPQGSQAAYFDHDVDDEFEIERPRGAPRLYQMLLHEKFQRAVDSLDLRGARVLVVCGGSGMDAEFLAEAGASVITSDISLGAARRARERGRRRGLDFDVIVSDAERLPFLDQSIDIAYVHDGLHHLEHPLAALAEMARVSRFAVCVTEPARAAATAVAIRLGLAQDVEEAGNHVARLSTLEVSAVLVGRDFEVVTACRYAMLYRHEPGLAMRVLSKPVLLPIATAGLRLANAAIGPFGNKLAVTARRR